MFRKQESTGVSGKIVAPMLPQTEQAVRRKNLTVEFIRSRKPASTGKQIDYFDAVVPGLALRVTDRGHKSFVMVARYPTHPKNPTRRFLAKVYIPPKGQGPTDHDEKPSETKITGGVLTLAEAREKARRWLELLSLGIDPADEERRRKVETEKRITFGDLREEFLKRYRTKSGKPLKKLVEARRILTGDFTAWDARAAIEIDAQDVAAAIRDIVDRGSPYQARNALQYVGCLFSWAVGNPEFGIKSSPAAGTQAGNTDRRQGSSRPSAEQL